jgi:hypothetical protein
VISFPIGMLDTARDIPTPEGIELTCAWPARWRGRGLTVDVLLRVSSSSW